MDSLRALVLAGLAILVAGCKSLSESTTKDLTVGPANQAQLMPAAPAPRPDYLCQVPNGPLLSVWMTGVVATVPPEDPIADVAPPGPTDLCAAVVNAYMHPSTITAHAPANRSGGDGKGLALVDKSKNKPGGLSLVDRSNVCGRRYYEPGAFSYAWNWARDNGRNDPDGLALTSCQEARAASNLTCTGNCDVDNYAYAEIDQVSPDAPLLIWYEYCSSGCIAVNRGITYSGHYNSGTDTPAIYTHQEALSTCRANRADAAYYQGDLPSASELRDALQVTSRLSAYQAGNSSAYEFSTGGRWIWTNEIDAREGNQFGVLDASRLGSPSEWARGYRNYMLICVRRPK